MNGSVMDFPVSLNLPGYLPSPAGRHTFTQSDAIGSNGHHPRADLHTIPGLEDLFSGDMTNERIQAAPGSSSLPEEIGPQDLLPPLNLLKSDPERLCWKSSANSRYPVLKPLLPYIRSFLIASQACSLLELYFTSAFNVYMHPVCRHIHAYIFRKSSVMSATNPRPCSPALLASMLWAAAETGGADMLSWSHSKRRNVSRRLYILTIQLLRPLVHFDVGCALPAREGGGHGTHEPKTCSFRRSKAADGHVEDFLDGPPLAETEGSLDDIVTYIHVAAITSASEHKVASMRWWHAAFTLSRELKFNKEVVSVATRDSASRAVPANNSHGQEEMEVDPWFGLGSYNFDKGLLDFMETASDVSERPPVDEASSPMSEERQEERRRVWWILYIQDRHLALCYNRPLALLDAECEELLLPMDEASWQSGNFSADNARHDMPYSRDGQSTNNTAQRRAFPSFECTGHNLFGFFLPLMTIVGEIIDLNHAKNHPLLGVNRRTAAEFGGTEPEILRQLACYENSLRNFEAINARADYSIKQHAGQDVLHTKTVVAYATHVTHVLHILLAGKWDPVSLFDDEDCWISSPSFTSTMAHAVSAADAVSQILEVDPDLSFMPYFLGIQLLQGSFVLLLVIDRLQTKTDPRIINACEVIIRATEVCVATLDTEYQVRSTISS